MKLFYLLIVSLCFCVNDSYANLKKENQARALNIVKCENLSREREVLLFNCQLIKSQINEYFAGMNAYNSSGRINAIKQGLTQYLYSVNSEEAWKLLREMQANDFAEWTR